MGRSSMVIGWNRDKTYQCPQCHHDTVEMPSSWEVYTCCNCGTRFARFPRLERLLRHVGMTCEACTERHPVPVDGQPFGFLRRRHMGHNDRFLFEGWLHDPDEVPDHRDGVRYINTRASRVDAVADIAHWRSFLGRAEDDLSPVLAVVVDEEFDKWGAAWTADGRLDGFYDRTLKVYGVGVVHPHPNHGRFHADAGTFTWGLIAPSGLEGLFTQVGRLPESLAAHAPQV
ncbi:hypothetical protein [Streptomyces mirabilis]|uniref:hypothetical protein n=1 Tax=Streptomyces mirabilis TaxID=68239 RepID=UPI0033C89D77